MHISLVEYIGRIKKRTKISKLTPQTYSKNEADCKISLKKDTLWLHISQ